VVAKLKAHGVHSMSLSLDGSCPERHDDFRGVPGCFDSTLAAARTIRSEGIPLQINTLVTSETLDDLPAIHELLCGVDIERWSLFFLVQVGRGESLSPITAEESEQLFNWLYGRLSTSPFVIKTTEAMHYRRVALQRMKAAGIAPREIQRTPIGRGFGIRDGNGIMFISQLGEVYPSGFLPLVAGSIRDKSPAEIYRESDLFCDLRDPSRYAGKCGYCEFNAICGGSRARAFAATGDPLASDPLCVYQPQGVKDLA